MCVCCVYKLFIMDFSLFVISVCFGFFVPLENISLNDIWRVLTYTRYSWSLCSEGSLKSRTYSVTGQPFIMIIKGRSRTGAKGAHTLFEVFWSVFVKFTCKTLILSLCVNCCQHSMFIIFILFSTFTIYDIKVIHV